jgi:chromosome segregation ATPase
MSAFTSSAGGQFAGALGLAFAAARAASERGEDWAAQAKRYRRLAEDYKEAYDKLYEALTITKEGAQEARQTRDFLLGKLAEATQELADARGVIRSLNDDLRSASAALNEATAHLRDATALVKRLQEEKRQLIEAHRQQMQQALERETRQVEELKARVAELQRREAEAVSRAEAAARQVERLSAEREELRRWHAANLALRCALEVQLLRADADNPLLQDQDLRDRVRRAGEMAVTMLGEAPEAGAPDPFDMAREAGLTFSVPGRPNSVEVLSELALAEVYMRRLLALNLPADRAMEVLQRLGRGEGAASAARELLREMEPGSVLLKPETVERVQGIAMEEFQRQQQQRRLSRGGPSAAWSAAMLGHAETRARALRALGAA